MKTIENKSIVTGKQLEEAGWQWVSENNESVIFGQGYERRLYERLVGKSERYKYIIDCKSKRKYIK